MRYKLIAVVVLLIFAVSFLGLFYNLYIQYNISKSIQAEKISTIPVKEIKAVKNNSDTNVRLDIDNKVIRNFQWYYS